MIEGKRRKGRPRSWLIDWPNKISYRTPSPWLLCSCWRSSSMALYVWGHELSAMTGTNQPPPPDIDKNVRFASHSYSPPFSTVLERHSCLKLLQIWQNHKNHNVYNIWKWINHTLQQCRYVTETYIVSEKNTLSILRFIFRYYPYTDIIHCYLKVEHADDNSNVQKLNKQYEIWQQM